ncbi:saccharopine dehydrogenase family protein [Chryseolinea lacunae]|uniref:Saccharopine dehydrogenase NADP-binding domain-containing protein n=1 Tax=Chryseolinea lacunae TaxID=2801331 RepID=A0ABS1KNQ3_9BACT|nr:saccharopine dehydrogenase C-terminal domain-containing protein [Chryseolinea lacunae]MBL0740877.1 saccharopine dehydrogenase NADP-binding domain-containing protein [Chryseolinea lacunae]
MKEILVLGAGRSSTSLIQYLLRHAPAGQWSVTVGDVSEQSAREKIGTSVNGRAIVFDIMNEALSSAAIQGADVVISLMPANLHPLVAKHCLKHSKHLLNASYVSDEMKTFHDEALAKGLLFLNECGLDPGIDHMSAMQVIDNIKARGGKLTSFESFTGGLIAPETDPENPWRYKFTWNPRNVVMAGQGTAKFLQNGQYKYIPYQQLFQRITTVSVPGYGDYEGYANRDSLKYLETYGLQGIQTMLRGTLRNKGYCPAWNVLVQLGCCDDTYALDSVDKMTHRSFINSFLDFHDTQRVEEKLCAVLKLSPEGEEMKRLRWSGLFTSDPVGLATGTPAQILEHILSKRWKLIPGDKDLIVMWHRFRYEADGKKKEIQAHLIATGEDEVHTAMAKTVGLPVGIAAKLLLEGKFKTRGVAIPVKKEFYDPILHELSQTGIHLVEREY